LGPDGQWVTAIASTEWGVYVGTHDDGVFWLDPSSNHWLPLGLDHAIVSSIVFVPGPTKRLLVGVMPYAEETTAAAVFASEDRGRSWIPWDGGLAASQGYRAWSYSLAVDPGNPARLYAGGNYSVRRSEDGGFFWQTVWGIEPGAGGGINGIAVSPRGDGTVWAGGESGISFAALLRSRDSGQSWQLFFPNPREQEGIIEENGIHSLAVDPTQPERLFVGMKFGWVMRSLDAGTTWQPSLRAADHAGFVLAMTYVGSALFAATSENFRPPSGGVGPPITDLGLYRTVDGGETWERLEVPATARGGEALGHDSVGALLIGTRGGGVWRLAR